MAFSVRQVNIRHKLGRTSFIAGLSLPQQMKHYVRNTRFEGKKVSNNLPPELQKAFIRDLDKLPKETNDLEQLVMNMNAFVDAYIYSPSTATNIFQLPGSKPLLFGQEGLKYLTESELGITLEPDQSFMHAIAKINALTYISSIGKAGKTIQAHKIIFKGDRMVDELINIDVSNINFTPLIGAIEDAGLAFLPIRINEEIVGMSVYTFNTVNDKGMIKSVFGDPGSQFAIVSMSYFYWIQQLAKYSSDVLSELYHSGKIGEYK